MDRRYHRSLYTPELTIILVCTIDIPSSAKEDENHHCGTYSVSQWFSSYFTDNSQSIKIKMFFFSDPLLPQSSVPRYVLFTLNTTPDIQIIENHAVTTVRIICHLSNFIYFFCILAVFFTIDLYSQFIGILLYII